MLIQIYLDIFKTPNNSSFYLNIPEFPIFCRCPSIAILLNIVHSESFFFCCFPLNAPKFNNIIFFSNALLPPSNLFLFPGAFMITQIVFEFFDTYDISVGLFNGLKVIRSIFKARLRSVEFLLRLENLFKSRQKV